MESLRITAAALKALPEYSMSLPTGTTIGRRWKHRPRGVGDDWTIGEYVPDDDPTQIGIKWMKPEITSDPDAVRRSMELFVKRATNWALGLHSTFPGDYEGARTGWAAMLDDWRDELTLPYHKVLDPLFVPEITPKTSIANEVIEMISIRAVFLRDPYALEPFPANKMSPRRRFDFSDGSAIEWNGKPRNEGAGWEAV